MTAPEFEDSVWATVRKFCQEGNIKEVRGWHLPHYLKLKTADLVPREKAIPMIAGENFTLTDLQNAYFSGADHF